MTGAFAGKIHEKKEKNEDKIPRKKDARPGLVGKKEIGKKCESSRPCD